MLACGVALDPLAEMWMHELKGTGDLDPFEQVSHRFVSGIDDESIGYAAESLKLLRAEVERRTERLKALDRDAVPGQEGHPADRQQAQPEAVAARVRHRRGQNLFAHPKYGKQAGEDAEFIIKIGRALGVFLVLATQRPDKASRCPPGVSGNVSHPVLPEGHRPGRERHDPRHVGVQERAAGDHVPAEDRRRARLPARARRTRRRSSAPTT